MLHQVMRISARAAAGVFAGLAGRLVLDLVSAPPGQAARFTASLLGICEYYTCTTRAANLSTH